MKKQVTSNTKPATSLQQSAAHNWQQNPGENPGGVLFLYNQRIPPNKAVQAATLKGKALFICTAM
ncbi:MAG: hypothetical protein AB7S69_16740 [Salinivirgaceae bacterium]